MLVLVLFCGFARAKDSASPLERRDVVVHIAVIDHIAFSDDGYDEVNEFLTENIPEATLLSVKVEGSILRLDRDRIRAELLQGLRGLLRPGDVISHLVIDTHGNTITQTTPNDTTRLTHLGEFTNRSIDADLAAVLAPLAGRLLPSATIVLNSCLTLCGTTPEAAARAKTFLKALGAPNGQIYGSTTPEVEEPGALVGRSRLRGYLGDLDQFKLFMSLGLALGLPYAAVTDLGHSSFLLSQLPLYLKHAGIAVGTVSASFYGLAVMMKAALARFGGINVGRIMIFKNGELQSDQPVDKYPARLAIYGLQCRALFE